MPRTPAARVLLPPVCLSVRRMSSRSASSTVVPIGTTRSGSATCAIVSVLTPSGGGRCSARITRADDDSPLDHVPELAHVSGPPMPLENVQRVLVDAADAAAVTIVELL